LHFDPLRANFAVMAERRSPKRPLNHKPAAVKRARERTGLTRTEVARELGVSLSLISEIEGGTRSATPAMILRLAALLNCAADSLRRVRLDTQPDNLRRIRLDTRQRVDA
jgi:transcriptional regulator with XRE-family HTH domain